MNTQIKFIIDFIKKNEIKSVLNVGYRMSSDKNIQNFCYENNIEWSVLEVFTENCDFLKKNGHNYKIYNIDVRDIKNIDVEWDLIIWLHGPEHVSWEDFLKIKFDIEKKCKKGVIYQAPIGEHPQDEMYGNVYEKHLSSLYPEMFVEIGYSTEIHKNQNENTFSAFLLKI